MRYEVLRPRLRINVEAVPSVEADRPLVVLKHVKPHRPVPAQPIHAGLHQSIGHAPTVESRVDHQPVELTAVSRVDRSDHVASKGAVDERHREQLVFVPCSGERGISAYPDDPAVRFDFLRVQNASIEGCGGCPFGQRRDVGSGKAI